MFNAIGQIRWDVESLHEAVVEFELIQALTECLDLHALGSIVFKAPEQGSNGNGIGFVGL